MSVQLHVMKRSYVEHMWVHADQEDICNPDFEVEALKLLLIIDTPPYINYTHYMFIVETNELFYCHYMASLHNRLVVMIGEKVTDEEIYSLAFRNICECL